MALTLNRSPTVILVSSTWICPMASGVGVGVGGVAVGVGVSAAVGVAVGARVGVGVGTAVAVGVGMNGVGVGVVANGVGVAVGCGAGVAVGVKTVLAGEPGAALTVMVALASSESSEDASNCMVTLPARQASMVKLESGMTLTSSSAPSLPPTDGGQSAPFTATAAPETLNL